jgi:hypothetical protein
MDLSVGRPHSLALTMVKMKHGLVKSKESDEDEDLCNITTVTLFDD